MDNTVTQNACDNVNPAKGAAGVGAGFLRGLAFNNIHGNLRAGIPSDFGWFHPLDEGFGTWVSDISITDNWWGTTDADAIAATITDAGDIEGVGKVDPKPFLTGPVTQATPRVTITTRRLRYEDPGDRMPVFLNLYNPGDKADFVLRIMVQYDDGPTVPYTGKIEIPGAVRAMGAWRFSMPANSAYFEVLLDPVYQPEDLGFDHAFWHATLADSKTGAVAGRPCSIRTDFSKKKVAP